MCTQLELYPWDVSLTSYRSRVGKKWNKVGWFCSPIELILDLLTVAILELNKGIKTLLETKAQTKENVYPLNKLNIFIVSESQTSAQTKD